MGFEGFEGDGSLNAVTDFDGLDGPEDFRGRSSVISALCGDNDCGSDGGMGGNGGGGGIRLC